MDISKEEFIKLIGMIPEYEGLNNLLKHMEKDIVICENMNWVYLELETYIFEKYVDDKIGDRKYMRYRINRYEEYHEEERPVLDTFSLIKNIFSKNLKKDYEPNIIDYKLDIVFVDRIKKRKLKYDEVVEKLKNDRELFAYRKPWKGGFFIHYSNLDKGEGLYLSEYIKTKDDNKFNPLTNDRAADDWRIRTFKGGFDNND